MARLELIVDSSQAAQGFRRAQESSERYKSSAQAATTATGRVRGAFAALASTARGAVVPALAGGAGVAFAFSRVISQTAQFEQQLVSVGKTTDIEGERLQALGRRIQGINQELPVATDRLLSLATAAGQLGVEGSDNIAKFTETLGQLELATDVQGEQGARALARILNVTGEATDNVDRLGSALVALGNNFAATESEIINTSRFLAASTSQFELTTQQVTGLSAGLQALGQRAETSGSSVGAALTEINKAIQNGGENLQTLTQLTGKTVDELRQQFQQDATSVLLDFTEALRGVSDARFPQILEQFSLSGRETKRVINALVQGNDTLRRAVQQSRDEWQRNTAAQEEAQKASDTLQGDFTRLANATSELLVQEDGLPAIRGAVQDLTDTLSDEQFQQGFDTFISGLSRIAGLGVDAAGAVAQFASQTGNVARFLAEEFAAAQGGIASDDIVRLEDRLAELQDRRERIQSRIESGGAQRGAQESLDAVNEQIATFEKRLEQAREAQTQALQQRQKDNEETRRQAELLSNVNEQIAILKNEQGIAGGSPIPSSKEGQTGDSTDPLAREFGDDFSAASSEKLPTVLEATRNATNALNRDFDDAADSITSDQERIRREQEEVNETIARTGEAIGDNFARAAVEGEDLSSVLKELKNDLQNIAAQQISEGIATAIVQGFSTSSTGSQVGGQLGGQIGANAVDGTKAEGGPVNKGGAFIVGERGPELFTPSQDGNITPNNELNRRPVVENNVIIKDGPGEPQVTQSESEGPDGKKVLETIIDKQVSDSINKGRLDKPMGNRFGLTPRQRRR